MSGTICDPKGSGSLRAELVVTGYVSSDGRMRSVEYDGRDGAHHANVTSLADIFEALGIDTIEPGAHCRIQVEQLKDES